MPLKEPENCNTFPICVDACIYLTFDINSNVRQVPDAQEVFLDPNGFTNIIVETLERVKGFESDREAVDFILQDILEAEDTIKVWNVSKSTLPKLGYGKPPFTTRHNGKLNAR